MRFVLIRHGQSVNNLIFEQTGEDLGREPDPRLTELGHRQARRLAASVAEGVLPWALTAVHTSLMARAIETAAPLADALDLPLLAHPEIFECGGPYHEVDGETVAHPGSDPADLAALSDRLELPEPSADGPGWWSGPFEAEESAYVDRARRVVTDLRGSHDADAVVALVTHGWFTQYLLRELLGIPSMKGWVEIGNTGISLLRDEGDRWAGTTTAVRLNWLPHLDDHHHST